MMKQVNERELLRRLEENDRLFLRRFHSLLRGTFSRVRSVLGEEQLMEKVLAIERAETRKMSEFLGKEVMSVFAIGEAHAALLCKEKIKRFEKNKLSSFLPWFLDLLPRQLVDLMNVDPQDFWLRPKEAIEAFKMRESMLAKDVSGAIWKEVKPIMAEHLDNVPRRETIAKLEKLQGVTERRAELIVTTESTYAYNRGRLAGFKKAEVDYVRFSAVMDARTSQQCRSRHGKVMRIDGAEIAGNTPPLHGRCRSILSPIYSKYEPEEITPTSTDWSKVVPLPKSWRTSADAVINESKVVKSVEQAKKRDHKIVITDTAIDKIQKVAVKGLLPSQNELLWQEHKNVLRMAKLQNNSNEVLSIANSDFSKRVYTLGSEFGVDPNNNLEALMFINTAKPRSLFYIHNHPSTNIFSTNDLIAFIEGQSIRSMSVVTNQGEVYILHKSEKYDYNKVRNILRNIGKDYDVNDFNGTEIVKSFLKQCQIGGVDYERK